MTRFLRGDRVQLSAIGREIARQADYDRHGTIASKPRGALTAMVLWDGLTVPQSWAVECLKLVKEQG